MELKEALKKDGRVELLGYGSAYRDSDGVLKWRDNNMPVPVYLLIGDKWFNYIPEPEKCEACRDETFLNKSDPSYKAYYTEEMRHHLRRYHCTCK